MKAGIEKRIEALEVAAKPSKGFPISSLVDLAAWSELEGDVPVDLSECDDELLRLIVSMTEEAGDEEH